MKRLIFTFIFLLFTTISYADIYGAIDELEYLLDVNISSPSDNQVLTYDSTTSKWVNQKASDFTKTISISAAGADYTTIQAALDANTAGGELFIVYPGTYTDDTIAFTANNQCVVGAGLTPQALVTSATAGIVDFSSFTGCRIQNVKMTVTNPTSLVHTVTGSTGSLFLRWCHLGMNNSQVTGSSQPCCLHTTGAADITMNFGTIDYDNSVNDATAIKTGGLLATGATMTVKRATFDIDGSNSSAAITAFYGVSTGTLEISRCNLDLDDTGTTLAVGFGYLTGSGVSELYGNEIHITTGSGTGYGVLISGTVTYRTMYNHIHVLDSGGTSYAYSVGSGTTLVSQFDDLIAADGVENNGTYTYVNSDVEGDFQTSGDIAINGDDITSDGDLTITPTGDDVLIDGGLTVGSTTQAGDNNLRIEGNSTVIGGSVFIAEKANADTDIEGQGQIWVKTATPNELYFTNDAGTDTQLVGAAAGDITDVWSDDAGDVSALTAASGDTLDASNADSTIPTKVNNTAAPTTEGEMIWDADNDILTIGDGAATDYVAYGASDGAALAGDSATSFFDAGTIEHERGGLEADVSGYSDGLYGMASGVTTDIDTIAEIETAIGGSTNIITETEMDASSELLALIDDETGTGNVVFSASPSLSGTVTFNDTSNATCANIDNDGTGIGLRVGLDGVLATNTYGVYIYSNADQDTGGSNLFRVKNDNNSSDEDMVEFENDGSGINVAVYSYDAVQAAGRPVVKIYSDQANTNAGTAVIELIQDNAGSSEPVLEIINDGSGNDIETGGTIEAGTFTEGGIAVLNNDEIDASSELAAIMDDETGTAGALVFSASPSLSGTVTFNDTSNATCANIDNDGTGIGLRIGLDGVLAANGQGAYIYSNAAQTETGSNLLKVLMDNSSSDEDMVELQNDGSGINLSVYSYDAVQAAGRPVVKIYSAQDNTNADSAVVLITQDNVGASEPCLELNNDGSGNDIETDSGAHLTAAGVWTDASCFFDTKVDLTKAPETGYINKIKNLNLYNYKRENDYYYGDGKINENAKTRLGFILDDETTPYELKEYDINGDISGKSGTAIAEYALATIKELINKVEVLEGRIEELENVN